MLINKTTCYFFEAGANNVMVPAENDDSAAIYPASPGDVTMAEASTVVPNPSKGEGGS